MAAEKKGCFLISLQKRRGKTLRTEHLHLRHTLGRQRGTRAVLHIWLRGKLTAAGLFSQEQHQAESRINIYYHSLWAPYFATISTYLLSKPLPNWKIRAEQSLCISVLLGDLLVLFLLAMRSHSLALSMLMSCTLAVQRASCQLYWMREGTLPHLAHWSCLVSKQTE